MNIADQAPIRIAGFDRQGIFMGCAWARVDGTWVGLCRNEYRDFESHVEAEAWLKDRGAIHVKQDDSKP